MNDEPSNTCPCSYNHSPCLFISCNHCPALFGYPTPETLADRYDIVPLTSASASHPRSTHQPHYHTSPVGVQRKSQVSNMEKTMDAATREVAEKGKTLTKACNSQEPTANIMAILQDLKATVRPTERLLRDSHIGRIVNKIKGMQGLDPQVHQLAAEIISRWRHIINVGKPGSGPSTPKDRNGTASPAPKSAPAPPPKVAPSGVDPAKRTYQTDVSNIKRFEEHTDH
jgi:hypothetical protein